MLLMNIVENSVAKVEIAHHEQFLTLPQCFQKSSAAGVSERVCVWEKVKTVCNIVIVCKTTKFR